MGGRRGQDVAAPVAPCHDVTQIGEGLGEYGMSRLARSRSSYAGSLGTDSIEPRTVFESVSPSPPERCSQPEILWCACGVQLEARTRYSGTAVGRSGVSPTSTG